MGGTKHSVFEELHSTMTTQNGRIGVSPAYLISAYGKHYTPENVCEALEQLTSWGFSNLQIEIFDADKIPLWLEGGGAKKVKQLKEKLGINISQLVGHLLIDDFASPSALFSNSGIETMNQMVSIAKELGCVDCITLPIGSFSKDVGSEREINRFSDEAFREQFTKKLRDLYEPARTAGIKVAVELLPKNVAGGFIRFHQIQKVIGSNGLGILFDTGHAWAAGEDVETIPHIFQCAIFGTHLCDNFGRESLKLAPGKGTIGWKKLIDSLVASQFNGYFDLEILCSPESLEEEYRRSFTFISSFIGDNRTPS